MDDDALAFILERTHSVAVAAGGWFFHENDPAQSMFVLEAGGVSVLRAWGDREWVVRQLDTGDCFGEMALMDLQPRSASVRADRDCTALELVPGTLLALFERDPGAFAMIQMNLGREVCRRLRETDSQLLRACMGEPPCFAAGLGRP